MIHVLVFVTTQPGMRAQVLEAFQANVPAVLAEDGCIAYEATIDVAGMPPSRGSVGDDTFVVIERWASVAALQAHAASPHMAAYGAKVKDWTASRTIHVLQAV